MSSRSRIQIVTLVASLALAAAWSGRAIATELAKQEVINNAAATAVPGTTGGEQWGRSSPYDNPRIDDAGNVVFRGALNTSSPGGAVVAANQRGIWYGGPGTLLLIARDGTTTPISPVAAGLPLTNPNGWWMNSTSNGAGLSGTPTLSPNGTLFISGQMNGTGANANNNTAFWIGPAGGVNIIAQRGFLPITGGIAPGTGGRPWNTNLNLSTSQFGVNNAGQVLFQSNVLAPEQRYISSLVASGTTVTGTTFLPHGYAPSTTIVVSGATPTGFNGTYSVVSVPTTTTFTYTITALPVRTVTTITGTGTTATATTSVAHGFAAGQTVTIAGASVAGYNGAYVVVSAPTTTTFTYANATTGSSTGGTATVTSPSGTLLSSTGRINAVSGTGTDVTVTTANPHGLSVGQTIAITGMTPSGYNTPGSNPAGAVVTATPSATTFVYKNTTTAAATVFGTFNSANDSGLWLGSSSSITPVMLRDDPAPGLGDPLLKLEAAPSFGLLVNGSGKVAFINKLMVGSGTSPVTLGDDYVMWTGAPGSLTLVARENDFVPGMGGPQYLASGNFTAPWTILTAGLSNDNSLHFSATLGGAGVTAGVDDQALFTYNGGTTTLRLRKGDAAPGLPGVNFGTFNTGNSRGSNSGTLLVAAVLTGAVTSGVDNESLWIVPSVGTPTMIARTGTVLSLPDLPAGTSISGAAGLVSSASPGLNNLGQVIFNASLTGPGITLGVNDRAVMAWDPVGGLMLVAQTGNDYGIVTGATQITPNAVFNGEGSCAGFSDTGWLVLNVANSNTGNMAVYRTKVVGMGACCYTDGSPCQMTTQADCGTGNLWRSDLTTCPVSCPQVGKCCYIDGTCAIRFQANCTGISWTAGQDCTNPCPLPGACCDAVTGLCSFVPQLLCTAAGNIWTGGADCTTVACLGSCCDPTYGTCMLSLKVDCPAPKIWTLGGSCTPNGCVQPVGACCMADGSCQQMTPIDCDAALSVRWTPGACGICPGKPVLFKTGLATNASGLSPDGQTVVSPVFHGDTATSPFHKYTRGTGFSQLAGGGVSVAGLPKVTNTGTVVAADQIDATNTSGLSPAFNRSLSKRWTSAGGIWNFLGTTGVPSGTPSPNACDTTIHGTDGLSDDGRYILVSGWSNSLCGPFRAWRFDSTGNSWSGALNLGTGSTQNRGYALSGDGATVVGWDMNNGTRKAAVWTFSLINGWPITVLDPSVGQSEIYAVNNNGTVIAGYMSPAGMTAAFGTTARTPIRWTRPTATSSVWTRTNLGGVDGMIPIAVSNDGNTIVGVGGTASDAWIWQPHMAAPTDLSTYLTRAGIDLTGAGIANWGAALSRGLTAMSRDGGTLLGAYTASTPCLSTGGGVLVSLNGTGVACEPPTIVYHPVSANYTTSNNFGGILNCINSGTLTPQPTPLTYQWQKEDPNNPGTWNNLSDDNCNDFGFFQVKGSNGPQLRLGMWLAGAFNDLRETWGNYRCIVTNACGSATTNSATMRMGGACCFPDGSCRILMPSSTLSGGLGCAQLGGIYRGDFTTCGASTCPTRGDLNCDGLINGKDVQAFTFAVVDPGTYGTTYPNCNILQGDTNNDSAVDLNDIPSFITLLLSQ